MWPDDGIKSIQIWECRHSSVDYSAPSILLTRFEAQASQIYSQICFTFVFALRKEWKCTLVQFLKKLPKFSKYCSYSNHISSCFFKERCFQKSHKLFEKEFVAQSGHTDDNNVKEWQSDQMPNLFERIWPSTTMKICQIVKHFCHSKINFLPNSK